MKKKNVFSHAAHAHGPRDAARAPERTAARSAAHTAPPHAREAARGEEACVHRHFCKNALALSNNSANTTRTISIDNDLTKKPSCSLVFVSERSPTPPCLSARHWPALSRYVDQLGPT